MEIKISVVIPTYRRPQLLVKCLHALNNQTLVRDSFEVIVVSDGPDPLTEQAVRSVDEFRWIQLLATRQKKGPAAARNLGWLRAKGKLIAFTDDDCIPDAAWLETALQEYHGQELAAFTGTMVVPVSEPPTDYERNIANLEIAEFVTANCICTKAALLKVGGFDERFQIAWREDSDLHFKLLEQHIPIKRIGAVVVHPVRQAPWGISLKEQKKGVFNALLYKKYPHLYRQRIKPKPSWNYYTMVSLFTACLLFAIASISWLAMACGLVWLMLIVQFTRRRLANTSHSAQHVLEMFFTSVLIPFLSVYWQFYGDFKYRTLLL